ncbi:hypothetical protein SAMN06295909_0124 [Plantibacter sp. VKM Ac-1784]|uniref:Uncharacterized protein n=1 Tax=Plantibacter elymi (nom. nud.) TaxID=199708 RepID=A0ABY1R830_9MICO|nr:hypothetical protein [Plantibacter sp. VKM Ac-1784]SMQ58219.1 hypothetical protein SAMN06295909_0124 [Plantibacter sp. VKM Ac-1784]
MTTEPESGRDEPSPETVAFLIESGAFTEESWARVVAAVARGDLAARERKSAQRALESTITPAMASARLGVDAAEVERMRSTGNLYAFCSEGRWRYPYWQFTGDRRQPLLPHLAFLIASIPVDMHPATVLGFMETPQRSARIDGKRVTPGEWLLSGGDPQVLRDIFDAFLMN